MTVAVSDPSLVPSSTGSIVIGAVREPAGIITGFAGGAKSIPGVAVPARSNSTVTGVAETVERVTVRLISPLPSVIVPPPVRVTTGKGAVPSSMLKLAVVTTPSVASVAPMRVTSTVSDPSIAPSASGSKSRSADRLPAGIVTGVGGAR